MLVQFRFKNYKSFKDEVILDMRATKGTEYKSQLVNSGYESILPAAAILGANASGKSNLIYAFNFMSYWVLKSYSFNNENEFGGEPNHPYQPFYFSVDSMTGASEFEVYFSVDSGEKSKVYNYGFMIDSDEILEEWLNVKSYKNGSFKSVFFREKNMIDEDSRLGDSTSFIKSNINNHVLVLSLTNILNVDVLRDVYDWFSQNMTLVLDPERTAYEYKTVPYGFDTDIKLRKNVLRYLAAFDPSIQDFDVKTVKDERGKVRFEIKALHKVKGSEKLFPMPLEMESSGTQKMFVLYKYLEFVLRNGSVFMIDELDSRLHPLLVRLIVNVFVNSDTNPNHAQLVFTTHDSWQLISEQLRRDELWFTDKNDDQESVLYSLTEFRDESGAKIRKDESLQKNYMLGKYGAVPEVEPLDMLSSGE